MTTGSQHSIINVTPLIDVLLVLMMIMMVIAPFTSRGLPAAIPAPSTDRTAPPNEPALVLRLDREANLSLNGEPLPDRDFDARLTRLRAHRSDPVLFVDADPELPFATVAKLLDRARGLGFAKAGLLPPDQRIEKP